MKHLIRILIVFALLAVPSSAFAQTEPYITEQGWTAHLDDTWTVTSDTDDSLAIVHETDGVLVLTRSDEITRLSTYALRMFRISFNEAIGAICTGTKVNRAKNAYWILSTCRTPATPVMNGIFIYQIFKTTDGDIFFAVEALGMVDEADAATFIAASELIIATIEE